MKRSTLADIEAEAERFRHSARIVAAAPKERVTLGVAILKAMDAGITARPDIIAHIQATRPETTIADIEAAVRLVVELMTADEETASR